MDSEHLPMQEGILVGPFSLDLKQSVVRYGEREVKLSNRELRLMRRLSEGRMSRVEAYEIILSTAKSEQNPPKQRTLDVVICYLRRKLGRLKEQGGGHILSVCGEGYEMAGAPVIPLVNRKTPRGPLRHSGAQLHSMYEERIRRAENR